MFACQQCGAQLGIGRFCTNCGAPIVPTPAHANTAATAQAGASPFEATRESTAIRPQVARGPEDTAERPRVGPPAAPMSGPIAGPVSPARPVPTPPPPTGEPSAYAGRFPLYADQVDPGEQLIPTRHDGEHKRRRPVGWVVLGAALLLTMVAGVVLLTNGDDDPGKDTAESTSAVERPEGDEAPGGDGEAPGGDDGAADPDDLAPHTKVSGPKPLKPGTDLNGSRVTYPATNLLDDDPETAYRLPGDATGAAITFTLPQETTIDGLGLVNGYAKLDTSGGQSVDWYAKNRRITAVEWAFDDGTTVTQELADDDPGLQTIGIDDVTTRTIELRIIAVSAPGSPPRSRDTTAISDVLIHGTS
jgi:hypothetical protein